MDPYTEEQISETPSVAIRFDEENTNHFEEFVQQTGACLTHLTDKHSQWDFLDVALNFLGKAFFTEGIEQLLWHITTLEAIVGEDKPGLTNKLRRRVSSILGKTQNERKEIRKQLDELYKFRSNLVHGNTALRTDRIDLRHLRRARDFSRKVLLWFLRFLSDMNLTLGEHVPTREELLAVLDLEKSSRARIGKLISNVPPEFPYIAEWICD
jgi:hypothetical protein